MQLNTFRIEGFFFLSPLSEFFPLTLRVYPSFLSFCLFSPMASSNIEDTIANLTLAELEDDGGIQQLENIPCGPVETEPQYFVVGRLVIDKLIKFPFFKDTIAALWRPAMGMNIKELQPKRYLFRFFHEGDLERIIKDGPWAYEQSLLILRRVEPHEDPESLVLMHSAFWIQVHGLPVGYRSDAILQAVGNFIGTLVKTDERNFDGTMHVFYRIRVVIDVSKPLKKGMRLKRDNGDWAMIEFRYERLPTFCFVCGLIGHGDKFCPKALLDRGSQVEKQYGAGLRAGGKTSGPAAGQRWLAPETYAERKLWKAPGKEGVGVVKGKDAQKMEFVPSAMQSMGISNPMHKVGNFPSDRETSPPPTVANHTSHSDELWISEQKRRRTNSVTGDDVSMDIEVVNPKNVMEAGLVLQARLDQ